MKISDLYEKIKSKIPFTLQLKECFVSGYKAAYVAQEIKSINYPEFRERIPVPKYIHGTIVVCDGMYEHTFQFHSTGFKVEGVVKTEEIKPIGNYDVVEVDMKPICNYFGEGDDEGGY